MRRITKFLATPHNIQRVTPQNTGCNNCHGNPDLFLMEDDVLPEELEANKSLIGPEPPPEMGSQ